MNISEIVDHCTTAERDSLIAELVRRHVTDEIDRPRPFEIHSDSWVIVGHLIPASIAPGAGASTTDL
jgi:hypothetical protein